MKRLLSFAFAAAILSGYRADAQYLMGGNGKDSTLPKIEFGIKLGADIRTITGNTWDNGTRLGPAGGIFVGMQKKKVAVRVEITADVARYTSDVLTDSLGNKGDFRVTYLNIPVLFEYNMFSHFWIQAGPQYTSILSVKALSDYGGDPKVIFRQGELSGILGVEGRFGHNLSFGLQFIYGFTDLNNDLIGSPDTWHSRTLQVYAAYRLK